MFIYFNSHRCKTVHKSTFSAGVKGIFIFLSKMSFILINGMPNLDNAVLLKPFFLLSKDCLQL